MNRPTKTLFSFGRGTFHYYIALYFWAHKKASSQVLRTSIFPFRRQLNGAFFLKSSAFYVVNVPRYLQNKQCCDHYETPGICVFLSSSCKAQRQSYIKICWNPSKWIWEYVIRSFLTSVWVTPDYVIRVVRSYKIRIVRFTINLIK